MLRNWTIRLVLFILVVSGTGQALASSIYYVDNASICTGSCGTDWTSAFRDIQSAVDSAAAGDEIWVRGGTYLISSDITVPVSVKIYGGFNGVETSRSQRDWITHETIVDGQSSVDHCFNVSADCTLDGFTITGGYALQNDDEPGTSNFGAGFIGLGCAPIVSNCVFRDNYAEMGGGGLDTWESSPVITNCRFSGNISVYGGAIRFRDSVATIDNCTFTVNDSATGRGGGIYALTSQCTITDTVFTENVSSYGGGFMCIGIGGEAVFSECTFTGNNAVQGGALYNSSGNLSLSKCTFDGNNSTWLGGAIFNINSVALEIASSRFYNNTARLGAALYDDTGPASLLNCLILSNTADYYAGGVYANNADTQITHVTFSQNAASRGGAAVTCANSSAPVLVNSILWDDTSDSGDPEIIHLNDTAPPVNVTFCNVDQSGYGNPDGSADASGNIRLDPLFLNPLLRDFHLTATSPCIDSGNATVAPAVDLDGSLRDAAPDMGAFEFLDSDTDSDGIEDPEDNCPDTYNPGQEDADGNGIGDACEATLVCLSDFTVVPGNSQVSVRWSTAAEMRNAGFNLYRATKKNGPYMQLNERLIPARGRPTIGADYEFSDTGLKNRRTCWYLLEDVDLDGQLTRHGPLPATPRLIDAKLQ